MNTIPSMSGITVVEHVEQVQHAPHYRRTLTGPDVTSDVFIEIKASWQVAHSHHFTDLDKKGFAICHSCGATAWCEAWVAQELYGDGTHSWADDLYRAFMERYEADKAQITALKHLAAQINSTRIVAAIDADQPARLTQHDYLPSM